jgi:enoyl-CoA hydratase
MDEPVDYRLEDSVATITMDDGKVNVLSPRMQAAIHRAFDQAEADGAAVVLRGRDGIFSAGFDLAILRDGTGDDGLAMVRGGFELALRVLAFPFPVVIACTGHAIAMGAFLLLSGDYRVGAAGAYRLVANEVAIGLPVPRPAIAILRHRLTPACADRASILAEPFTPDNAVAAGFLDRVVEPERLFDVAAELAAAARGLDQDAHAATKLRARDDLLTAVRAGIRLDYPTAAAAEAANVAAEVS